MRLGVTAFLTDRTLPPAALGREAEARGFRSLFLPEHTHLPVRADVPPALVDGVRAEDYRRSLDPLVALAMVASVTEHLELGTGVMLAAQHDPIVLAKQIATLDHLSGGRVVFGTGFGWNRAEAADHGVPFDRRREVARDHVLCMQAIWSQEQPSYHGTDVDLEPCWSWPKPMRQPHVPVLIGGAGTPATFASVAEYGDGWMPIGGAGLKEALPQLARVTEQAGRDPASVRVVPFGTMPTAGKLDHYRSLGLGEVVLRVPSGTADEMLGALDRLAVFVDEFGGDRG
jgi:probable F420-dependent oxidoreductase